MNKGQKDQEKLIVAYELKIINITLSECIKATFHPT